MAGIRVLDLAQAVSGPFAGRILGDLGADVVKVEWPRGDITNLFGKRVAGTAGLFLQMNAGKRGISVDLADAGGVELLRRLTERADVVIENFRPGVLDRAGLGYEALVATNPGLVMLSISGFGKDSPEAQRQAYAPVLHAESGLLDRQAVADGRAPADTTLALADTLAALHGTIAVLAALRLRDTTGQGQHIDLGMLQAMVASDDYTHNSIDKVAEIYPPRGDIWEAAGGPILVAADPKTIWVRVRDHTGVSDPAPADTTLPEKIAARTAVVASWIASFEDRAMLIAELAAAGLPWADLRTKDSLLDSPTLRAYDSVKTVDAPGGPRGVIRMPYRFSNASADVSGPSPTRGQHNGRVLADWLGLTGDEAAVLVDEGVLLQD